MPPSRHHGAVDGSSVTVFHGPSCRVNTLKRCPFNRSQPSRLRLGCYTIHNLTLFDRHVPKVTCSRTAIHPNGDGRNASQRTRRAPVRACHAISTTGMFNRIIHYLTDGPLTTTSLRLSVSHVAFNFIKITLSLQSH